MNPSKAFPSHCRNHSKYSTISKRLGKDFFLWETPRHG